MCLGYKIHFKNWTILKKGRICVKTFLCSSACILKTGRMRKNVFPHTPSESGTFPPCGLDEGATFR